MALKKICANKVDIDCQIFENYAQIQSMFIFNDIPLENLEISLPCVKNGIICDLTVTCDKEEFSHSKAMNIREAKSGSIGKTVYISDYKGEFLNLYISGLSKGKEIEVKVIYQTAMARKGCLSSLAIWGLERNCPIDINAEIYGEVKNVASPTHKIASFMYDDFCQAKTNDGHSDSFVLNIYYKDKRKNGIFISRQPFVRNIALCRFTPTFERLKENEPSFMVNIVISSSGARQDILLSAIKVLRCLKGHKFSVFINSIEVINGTEEDIESTIDLICDSEEIGRLEEVDYKDENIIICLGADYNEDVEIPENSLIILSKDFSNIALWEKKGRVVCVKDEDREWVIPYELNGKYGKSLDNALILGQGGIDTEILQTGEKLIEGESNFCFARHNIIPPKAIKILDENKSEIEKIDLEVISTDFQVRTIDVQYSLALIKYLRKQQEMANPEEYCIMRDKINQICIKNNIAMGDVVLYSVANGENSGVIYKEKEERKSEAKYFKEDVGIDKEMVLDLILKSQTIDGVIADISVFKENALIFSTAICLIALFLSTRSKYVLFAKRSLDFLRGKDGFWAKTAVDLWRGREVSEKEILSRLEMKHMFERVDELSIELVKNILENK